MYIYMCIYVICIYTNTRMIMIVFLMFLLKTHTFHYTICSIVLAHLRQYSPNTNNHQLAFGG
jgi:hypothetical protein